MTITARVVADSVSPAKVRLTTLQLRYPKFIHGELMTHRVFSRNASSSRAIPASRLIEDVLRDPAMPIHWGRNQPGMQADEEHDAAIEIGGSSYSRVGAWSVAMQQAVNVARACEQAGYHKQIVNRLIEPFCHINVVVTATEWSNFFALRCHPAAQPEMRVLAERMRDAMAGSAPVPRGGDEHPISNWHLPYVSEDEREEAYRTAPRGERVTSAIKVSVARCARVSYLTQDGKMPTIEEDLALYDRLVGAVPLHASPAEHQAKPDETIQRYSSRGQDPGVVGYIWRQPELHGNLRGWVQYRKTLPGECQ